MDTQNHSRGEGALSAHVVRGAIISTGAPASTVDISAPTSAAAVPIVHPRAVHTTTAATTTGADTEMSRSSVPPRSEAPSSATSMDSSIIEDHSVTLQFDFGTYVGEVDPISGLRAGYGTLTYTSGNVYEGEWRDGAANGTGEKRYANGDVYRGGWRDGKRAGRGGYLYAQGHYFEGMYADDEPNGYGVLRTVGGDRYAGHWRHGRKDGKGRETLQNGQVFVGHWRDGKKQGRGKLFLAGAQRFVFGIWNDDHFFRELTEEEMGVDGEIDVVDQYGLPTDVTDAESATAAAARAGVPPPPRQLAGALPQSVSDPIALEGLGSAITDAFLSGVAAVEGRLEALGRVLERAATGAAGDRPAQSTTATAATAPVGSAAVPPPEANAAGSHQRGPGQEGSDHSATAPPGSADAGPVVELSATDALGALLIAEPTVAAASLNAEFE